MTTALVRAVASVLLRYPDDALFADLSTLDAACATLPPAPAAALGRFLAHARAAGPDALREHYVATFDLRRKFCLYLSYYLNGDTRRRGAALVGFKDVYRRAGFVPADGELPDYLPTVLEFAATGDAALAEDLLRVHRRGLQTLLIALRDAGSPYADVVGAVDATLPGLTERELDEAVLLAVQGPPAEQVGLEPFGPLTIGSRR